MNTTITCKYCGRELEISEALQHKIEEQALVNEREKHQKELSAALKIASDDAFKKAQNQFESNIKQLSEAAQEEKLRSRKFEEQLIELTRELRKARSEKDDAVIAMQKKLLEEEAKIRIVERNKVIEEHELKDLEKEKKLQDALKQIEELRTKIQQGSQQTQGEVLELEIEETLRREFPSDQILEVKKGQRGADVIQKVIDKNGHECGIILWESKNAQWSEGWIKKLREDQREANATLAVLVSVNLPPDIKTFSYRDKIWITNRHLITPLAIALRFDLIHIFHEKSLNIGKNEKMETLYQYLTGTEFKHRIEAIVEAFTNLNTDIEREKRWFAIKWARQEKELRKIVDNTHGMYGELQAVTGRSLESIKQLESPEDEKELEKL
jgi:hypothetical protein